VGTTTSSDPGKERFVRLRAKEATDRRGSYEKAAGYTLVVEGTFEIVLELV
jgi:hypothetical protein